MFNNPVSSFFFRRLVMKLLSPEEQAIKRADGTEASAINLTKSTSYHLASFDLMK